MNADAPKNEEDPVCVSCGACCFSTNPRYVRVTGKDYARLAESAEQMTHFVENRCYMRICGNRCIALAVDSQTKSFFCNIYDIRPRICRELVPGSSHCLAEIERKFDLARTELERFPVE